MGYFSQFAEFWFLSKKYSKIFPIFVALIVYNFSVELNNIYTLYTTKPIEHF